MGKSSKQKAKVADYQMSIHFGICLAGNVKLKKIWIGEKEAWSGDISTLTTNLINKPDLFGGVQKEGGVEGAFTFLPGDSSQTLPTPLASRLGDIPANLPSYRGLASVWFTGSQNVNSYVQNRINLIPQTQALAANGYVGNSAYNTTTYSGGFKWGSNNPIIQSVWVDIESLPTSLGVLNSNIGGNANPAHIIYEAYIDQDFGANKPTSQINTASFQAAAQTLYDEGFGLSMMWTQETEVEAFVKEVLDHIQGVTFTNPKTGLDEIKLLRDDYVQASCRILTPDNSDISDLQRKVWGETANEISVSWTNPENEKSESIVVADIANVANQGAIVASSRNYYGIRNKELGEKVAWRELRQSAYPLLTANFKLNRTLWDVTPGEVLKIDYPEEGLQEIFVRVLEIDYGTVDNSEINISVIEDIFALTKAKPRVPQTPLFDNNLEQPLPITDYMIFTPPAHWVMLNDPSALRKIDIAESLSCVLGYSSQNTAYSFNLASRQPDGGGSLQWEFGESKTTIGKTTLTSALPIEVMSYVSQLPSVGGIIPSKGDWVLLGTTEATQEICLVGSLTASGWELHRGMLDTTPKVWASGSTYRIIKGQARVIDTFHEKAVGETCEYRLLTNTEGGQLVLTDATTISGVVSDRLLKPLRPANVKINGSLSSTIAVTPVGNMVITWANRNRFVEESFAPKYDESTEQPETNQRTIIRTKTTGGVLIREYVHLWNDVTYTIPCSWYEKYASILIEVVSERNGFESLQKNTFTITGLANNAGGVNPPAATAAGTPPAGFDGVGDPIPWNDIIDVDGTMPQDNADVTATSAAMIAANARIVDILSDGLITAGQEKTDFLSKIAVINGGYSRLIIQSAALSVSSTALAVAYNTWNTYVTGLTDYSNTSVDTAVNKAIYDANYLGYNNAVKDIENAIAASTSNVAFGANNIKDAQQSQGLKFRSIGWDTIPALPILYEGNDTNIGKFSYLATPNTSAFGSGNYYSICQHDNYLNGPILGAGRVGYCVTVNVIDTTKWLRVWASLMVLNAQTNVWETSSEVDYNLSMGGGQDLWSYFDTTASKKYALYVWGQLKTTVTTTQFISTWKPLISPMLASQTAKPTWSPSSNTEDGADVTLNAVHSLTSNVSSVDIQHDWQGNILSGQSPKTVNCTYKVGTNDVSSSVSWEIVGTPTLTASINSSGILSVTAISASTQVTVRGTYGGYSKDVNIQFNKILAAPPNTGGGGTSVSDSTLGSINDSTLLPISDEMTVKTGSAGKISFSSDLTFSFEADSTNGYSSANLKWQYKPIGGSFSDVTAQDESDFPAYDGSHGTFFEPSEGGSCTYSPEKTGLSANTDYVVRLLGSRASTDPSGAINFYGTAAAVGS